MSDAEFTVHIDGPINAAIRGIIGGFAAVGATTIALRALQVYQRRQTREQVAGEFNELTHELRTRGLGRGGDDG